MKVSLDFYMLEAKPENLVGDRAFDSDRLGVELEKAGVKLIAPHCFNRRMLRTQDGRPLRRYLRRWVVERFFAWLQWQRRLLIRWGYYAANFLGFVQPGCITMLLRRS